MRHRKWRGNISYPRYVSCAPLLRVPTMQTTQLAIQRILQAHTMREVRRLAMRLAVAAFCAGCWFALLQSLSLIGFVLSPAALIATIVAVVFGLAFTACVVVGAGSSEPDEDR